ncbi:SDR family oxidoreductase [Pacificibacter marinus]|uniref:Quinone oxidoreductase 2 n=1 Tax=Pacificibacter marinus TaxID=658057 RepID=A0A1Y5SK03_9RHOB|nr:SDR family oxidoreductase [Pacificibacter marinus]SEK60555.1 NAD(P)H dehydrogenase (quinone) [Pacificibacter marinus]SLN41940.1 Quinone oxidoreductase 2 [Pacificibacter marinus]
MTKYLVTGAAGQLGQLVVDQLTTRVDKDDIIALVRKPEQADAFAAKGIATRMGDYTDSASLETALTGVDRVLLISSNDMTPGAREVHHGNVINAAKKAGVGFIAYTSLLNAKDNPMHLGNDHRATEDILANSGVAHTILRNGWYTENFGMGLAQALETGQHFGASGDGKYSTAARADYAEAAAVVLAGGHDGQILELAGDDAFTLTDLAKTISDASGKNVAYVDMPVEAFGEALKSAGVPEGFVMFMKDIDGNAAKGALFNDDKVLSALIGRPTTPYAETLQAMVAQS